MMVNLESILGLRRRLQGYNQLDSGKSTTRGSRGLHLYLFLVLIIVATVISGVWLTLLSPPRTIHVGQEPASRSARLHLLIPATSSNENLCRLFLSAFALGYPTPTIINWAAAESPDKFVQHMAKVQGIADYLARLQANSGHEDDLVLVVDGYDVWFQLGPEVLLKRYFDTLRVLDRQAIDTFGHEIATKHDMRHTILFGPDKLCWPSEADSRACWALPKPALSPSAFGPHTETRLKEEPDYSMPRWLNSGTIIGPIDDLQRMFTATLNRIQANFTVSSDQFYFADIFGAQEVARLHHRPDLLEAMHGDVLQGRNDEGLDHSAELHIGLDHRSSMFQTVGMYKHFLMWAQPQFTTVSPSALPDEQRLQAFYHQELPLDILQSRPPFATLKNVSLQQIEWSEVNLLHNTITRTIPAIIHFTSDKLLRSWWWENVWFQSSLHALRQAYMETTRPHVLSANVESKTWYAGEHDQPWNTNLIPGTGVWSDHDQWIPWDTTCQAYEQELSS